MYGIHVTTVFPVTPSETLLFFSADRLLDGCTVAESGRNPFYNAGVDPQVDDSLGKLALSDTGLLARERLVVTCCRRAGVPLATVVGGGYARDTLALARRHALVHQAAREALA